MKTVRNICAALIFVFAIGACAHADNRHAHYDITLSLDPANGLMAATVEASVIPCRGETARLYLNRALSITEVTVDARPVLPVIDPPGAEPFWLSSGRAFDIPCPGDRLRMSYDGPGRLHPDGRNQVSENLIELSLYGGWYPMTAIDRPFTWRLQTALPDGWTYAAVGAGERSGTRRIDLASDETTDVVLIASPRFVDLKVSAGGAASRVLLSDDATAEDVRVAEGLGREAADMAAWLEAVLGPAKDEGPTRPELVFTRRGGPLSYARLPLIVTPQSSLSQPGDRPLALNVRHEVAHFWSRSKGAANDWINEGVAEYLALARTRDRDGESAYQAPIALYRAQVAAAGPGVSIVDTPSDASRGYVNRYQRPALLLDALERDIGRPATERLLREMFALGADQTAASVIALAHEALGQEQGKRIAACLAARDWPAVCGGTPQTLENSPLLPADQATRPTP